MNRHAFAACRLTTAQAERLLRSACRDDGLKLVPSGVPARLEARSKTRTLSSRELDEAFARALGTGPCRHTVAGGIVVLLPGTQTERHSA